VHPNQGGTEGGREGQREGRKEKGGGREVKGSSSPTRKPVSATASE